MKAMRRLRQKNTSDSLTVDEEQHSLTSLDESSAGCKQYEPMKGFDKLMILLVFLAGKEEGG